MNEHPKYKNPDWIIYGPYLRKDGRQHVIAYDGTKRITISYPKYLMECHIGRELKDDEEVHHKNELVTDDQIDNYEIINSTQHRHNHTYKGEQEIAYCVVCDSPIILEGKRLSDYRRNRLQNRKGPYCSRSCQGKECN